METGYLRVLTGRCIQVSRNPTVKSADSISGDSTYRERCRQGIPRSYQEGCRQGVPESYKEECRQNMSGLYQEGCKHGILGLYQEECRQQSRDSTRKGVDSVYRILSGRGKTGVSDSDQE